MFLTKPTNIIFKKKIDPVYKVKFNKDLKVEQQLKQPLDIISSPLKQQQQQQQVGTPKRSTNNATNPSPITTKRNKDNNNEITKYNSIFPHSVTATDLTTPFNELKDINIIDCSQAVIIKINNSDNYQDIDNISLTNISLTTTTPATLNSSEPVSDDTRLTDSPSKLNRQTQQQHNYYKSHFLEKAIEDKSCSGSYTSKHKELFSSSSSTASSSPPLSSSSSSSPMCSVNSMSSRQTNLNIHNNTNNSNNNNNNTDLIDINNLHSNQLINDQSSSISSSSSSSTSSASYTADINYQNETIPPTNTTTIIPPSTTKSSTIITIINQEKETQQQQKIMPPTTTINLTSNSHNAPIVQFTFQTEIDDEIKRKIDEKLKECNDSDSETEAEFVNCYTPKAVDLPSVQRLAKRLYYLDGFRATDIVRHLSKK
jgi:hypothetical protein